MPDSSIDIKINAKIEINGATMDAVLNALDEARERIEAGNTSGFDRNNDSNFTFDVTGVA